MGEEPRGVGARSLARRRRGRPAPAGASRERTAEVFVEDRRRPYDLAGLERRVREYVEEQAALIASVDDPLTVTRQVGDFYAALHVELERVAVVRLRAIASLHARGWSYDRIARDSGISKARVAQLVRQARVALPDIDQRDRPVRPRGPGGP